MMTNTEPSISLSDGGIVTVLLAKEIELPTEFKDHPHVLAVEANGFSVMDVGKLFTTRSRGLITVGRVRDELLDRIKTAVARIKHPYIYRPNTHALKAELDKVLQTAPPPARRVLRAPSPPPPAVAADSTAAKKPTRGETMMPMMPKGYWPTFIEQHGGPDKAKGNAEEGRRFAALAKADGYNVSDGAASQAVLKYKRDHGVGSPRPVTPRSSAPRAGMTARQSVLKMLDDTIAGLGVLRDYVNKSETEIAELRKTLQAENADLRRKLDKSRKAAAAMLNDD